MQYVHCINTLFIFSRQSINTTPQSSVSTLHILPPLTIEHAPLGIEMMAPSFAYVRQRYGTQYKLHNRTPYPQDIDITMETSDAFMFRGYKQVFKISSLSMMNNIKILQC